MRAPSGAGARAFRHPRPVRSPSAPRARVGRRAAPVRRPVRAPARPEPVAAPYITGAATAVIIVPQALDPARFLPLLVGAAVLLVRAGDAGPWIRPKAPKYPGYWW
ncbi:hypothetical protein [Streptomyces sp. G-G2]|uniref:hypothetical protein n=1 Tax=Streptomyces sp. G-G2 TaxID=3046201 RepID=UPI0024BB9267|nr:hypothetical protein [Streptomyces sp. G-G2]MDJ0382059.1 hypothetical protein [Streptomyces sp. G-G2]